MRKSRISPDLFPYCIRISQIVAKTTFFDNVSNVLKEIQIEAWMIGNVGRRNIDWCWYEVGIAKQVIGVRVRSKDIATFVTLRWS